MGNPNKNKKPETPTSKLAPQNHNSDYLWSMSHAPRLGSEDFKAQLVPAIFFTAFVILITRMASYTRPMSDFYWFSGGNDQTDFFSYYKMIAVLICAGLALLMLLYRLCTQSLAIKKTPLYLPMAIYSLFVVLSYVFSDYKEFALLGYNDRFEGTLILLAYMVMLFFIINSVDNERGVKWMLYPIILTSVVLSLLGISQATGHDFFQTAMGQKLIVPNYMTNSGATTWQMISQASAEGKPFLEFTFQNNEIYQTVYNINYVSFYLTLLIPLFGMLFIRSVNKGKEEVLWKKIAWGILFALLIFNLIGSASSGGFLGIGVIGLLGILILNKRILKWWKPVAILLVITLTVSGMTYERWLPEVTNAMNSVLGKTAISSEEIQTPQTTAVAPGSLKPSIEYIKTKKDTIVMSLNQEVLTIQTTLSADGQIDGFSLSDSEGKAIAMQASPTESGTYFINDDRWHDYATLSIAADGDTYYTIVNTADMQWPFAITKDQVYYRNQFGKLLILDETPHSGWENNPGFGSGRGYIWSRTLPMMKDTLLLGYGADTYCLNFPHDDYAGKYTTNFQGNLNVIVDKPHDMFMGMIIGTGGVSFLAALALWLIYIVQSVKLYWKHKFEGNDFLSFAGVGIFLGIVGFLVSGLVNDSTVSVMPMFYGLLGTGVVINLLLNRELIKEEK